MALLPTYIIIINIIIIIIPLFLYPTGYSYFSIYLSIFCALSRLSSFSICLSTPLFFSLYPPIPSHAPFVIPFLSLLYLSLPVPPFLLGSQLANAQEKAEFHFAGDAGSHRCVSRDSTEWRAGLGAQDSVALEKGQGRVHQEPEEPDCRFLVNDLPTYQVPRKLMSRPSSQTTAVYSVDGQIISGVRER